MKITYNTYKLSLLSYKCAKNDLNNQIFMRLVKDGFYYGVACIIITDKMLNFTLIKRIKGTYMCYKLSFFFALTHVVASVEIRSNFEIIFRILP